MAHYNRLVLNQPVKTTKYHELLKRVILEASGEVH